MSSYFSSHTDPLANEHDLKALLKDGEGNAADIANVVTQRPQGGRADSVPNYAVMVAKSVVRWAESSRELYGYLCKKMPLVGPNLTVLVGEVIAARFLEKARV
ncbi:hypothetical protein F5Y19DRAFT_475476 [Xylariaceae sp. FL1651]|nr:hypothetical protein F5Y19DRAFT_475476 [Xylariaceae sp. FL1651]